MITFSKDRKSNGSFILKKWLFSVAIFFIPYLIDWIFKTQLVKAGYPYIAGGFVFVNLFDKITAKRLHKVSFDNENQQVIFFYKSLFGNKRKIALYYEHAIVEVKEFKPKWYRKSESLNLYFLKTKTEIFYINSYKDGFETATLKEICKAAEGIPLAIKRL